MTLEIVVTTKKPWGRRERQVYQVKDTVKDKVVAEFEDRWEAVKYRKAELQRRRDLVTIDGFLKHPVTVRGLEHGELEDWSLVDLDRGEIQLRLSGTVTLRRSKKS